VIGLKKPSTYTITNHLRFLRKIDVLHKEEGSHGCTHYSLKCNHHEIYVMKVFCSLATFIYSFILTAVWLAFQALNFEAMVELQQEDFLC
jgi:hypothetical protein